MLYELLHNSLLDFLVRTLSVLEIYWRFVLPSWSGERNLRIRLAHHTTNRQINLHQITHWDGTTATDQFCNTNLLVYSI